LHYYKFARSGAIALLLFLCSFVAACGGEQTSVSTNEASGGQEKAASADSEEMITVEAVRPEDILSEEERTGAPKYRDWYEESGSEPIQLPVGTSAGPIPAVKPFNFGRDPGGPEDKTLYLTVPKLGLEDVAVFDSIEEEKLKESAIHVPATGFPWQTGRTSISRDTGSGTRTRTLSMCSTTSTSSWRVTRSPWKMPPATGTSTG
jgi:sortase A